MPTFLREYEKVAAEAAREGLDHVRFLLCLAELELIDRERRMVERRIRPARFPAVKSFDTFDFTARRAVELDASARPRIRTIAPGRAGGSGRSFTLQPLSIHAQTSLALAAGVASMTLRPGH